MHVASRPAAPRRLGDLRSGDAGRARRRRHRAPPHPEGVLGGRRRGSLRARRRAADRSRGDRSRDRRTTSGGARRSRSATSRPRIAGSLAGGDFGYAWLNAMGVQSFDVPDADDFVVSPGDGGPDWHLESVVYEVFPDRFASSGREVTPPDGRSRASWDELPTGRGPDTPVSGSAATFAGSRSASTTYVARRERPLPHARVPRAGARIATTPRTFDSVDPLLGGDEAFASLVRAAHARGIRVLGDLTTNHVGSGHEWFRRRAGAPRARARVLLLRRRLRARLRVLVRRAVAAEARLRVRGAARAHVRGSSAVVRRWLEPPYDLDGWRIDVANMTGRLGADDLLPDVACGVRRRGHGGAIRTALVVAEHAYDARADLRLGALARHDELRRASRARCGRGCAATTFRRAANGFFGLPRRRAAARPVSRSSARCARFAPAFRGRHRSTRGRSSTATTRRASASSRAHATASSSASACR